MFQEQYHLVLQQLFRDSRFVDTTRGKRGGDFPMISFMGSVGNDNREESTNSESLFKVHNDRDGNWRFEVSPVESLPGSVGLKVVLGMVFRGCDNRFFLEDIHQAVPVRFDQNMLASDDYITERMFVLVKGRMVDDVLNVYEMTFPPVPQRSLCEVQEETVGSAASTEFTVYLNDKTNEDSSYQTDSSVAVLNNVILDDQRTLDRLNQLFTGFEEANAVPSAFVIMGSFSKDKFNSSNGEWVRKYQKCIDSFAHTLSRFPITLAKSRIIIVPGTNDPSHGILPQPPLSDGLLRGLSSRFPSVTLATNPCRVKLMDRDLLFFNGDIVSDVKQKRLIGCGVGPEDGGYQDKQLLQEKIVRCLLSQMHLIPGITNNRTISWSKEDCMRLYPPPHALFISDPELHAFEKELFNSESLFVSTPSFTPGLEDPVSSGGDFHVYSPYENQTSLSSVE